MKFRYPDKPTPTTIEAVRKMDISAYIGQGKYDGHHLQITRQDKTHKFFTSSGKLMDNKPSFPREIHDQCAELDIPQNSMLDSEFVGPRGHHPTAVYLFDCLAWNGSWLVREPFEKRWQRIVALQEQVAQLPLVHLAWTFETDFLIHFNRLREEWIKNGRGMDLFEGIVLKRRSGLLRLDLNKSTKSLHMFKLKYREIRGEALC